MVLMAHIFLLLNFPLIILIVIYSCSFGVINCPDTTVLDEIFKFGGSHTNPFTNQCSIWCAAVSAVQKWPRDILLTAADQTSPRSAYIIAPPGLKTTKISRCWQIFETLGFLFLSLQQLGPNLAWESGPRVYFTMPNLPLIGVRCCPCGAKKTKILNFGTSFLLPLTAQY